MLAAIHHIQNITGEMTRIEYNMNIINVYGHRFQFPAATSGWWKAGGEMLLGWLLYVSNYLHIVLWVSLVLQHSVWSLK